MEGDRVEGLHKGMGKISTMLYVFAGFGAVDASSTTLKQYKSTGGYLGLRYQEQCSSRAN